jgi:hypothetical protein
MAKRWINAFSIDSLMNFILEQNLRNYPEIAIRRTKKLPRTCQKLLNKKSS